MFCLFCLAWPGFELADCGRLLPLGQQLPPLRQIRPQRLRDRRGSKKPERRPMLPLIIRINQTTIKNTGANNVSSINIDKFESAWE